MENLMDSARKFRSGRLAGIIGIGVNLFLFAGKLTAGLLIGSMAMVADAVNNVTDAASSILVLLGYVFAAKPADRKHPYGHARMEHLCSLMISILVTILGIELFTSSFDSLRAMAREPCFRRLPLGSWLFRSRSKSLLPFSIVSLANASIPRLSARLPWTASGMCVRPPL